MGAWGVLLYQNDDYLDFEAEMRDEAIRKAETEYNWFIAAALLQQHTGLLAALEPQSVKAIRSYIRSEMSAKNLAVWDQPGERKKSLQDLLDSLDNEASFLLRDQQMKKSKKTRKVRL